VADSLRRLDPAWSLEMRPLNEDVRRSVNVERLLAACAGVFAVLAVSMCVIGTSGVFACSVARRRREIGVRLALGATPGAVVRLLMHELVAVMIAGVVTGLLGAWLAGRLIQGFLFQVSAADPAMLSSAAIVILGAAGAAAAVPAVRASRLHPARVLRGE
jgi:ABC-type antimicrobial peptide transport system permease subunit